MPRAMMTREEAEASLAAYEKKRKTRKRGSAYVRKAYVALGDDATLCRWVKVPGEQPQRRARQLRL